MTTLTFGKQVDSFQALMVETFAQESKSADAVGNMLNMAIKLKIPDTNFISPNLPEGNKNFGLNTDAAFYCDTVEKLMESLPNGDRELAIACGDKANKDSYTGVDWKRGKKLRDKCYSYMGTTRTRLIAARAGLTQTGNKKRAPQTPNGKSAMGVDENELMLKARKRVEDLNKYLLTNMSEEISKQAGPLLVKVLALLIKH